MRTRILSPAKINLFLKVLGKRSDGFHELFSLMEPVSVYDEVDLEVEDGEGILVRCSNKGAPQGPKNLAYKSARALLEKTGTRKRVSIDILKRIPVGAGLGGGSSDCAAVLKGLNELLETGLSEKALMEIGASLGSDVPFFMLDGPALARGRGEVLERVMLPKYHYVIINPGFTVSTAWVYNNLDLTKKPQDNILMFSKKSIEDPSDIRDFLSNDLEGVTARKYQQIKELKGALEDAGALGSLMSGSGPTVFGIFLERRSAARAYEGIKSGLDVKHSVFLAHGIR